MDLCWDDFVVYLVIEFDLFGGFELVGYFDYRVVFCIF